MLFVPLLTIVLFMAAPRAASADTWITPYVGSSFNIDFAGVEPGRALFYGGSVTWLGGGGVGVELDLGYAPDFFDPDSDTFFDLEGDGNVTTLMANLVASRGMGVVHPYIAGGVGLMRSRLGSAGDLFDYSDHAFGLNAGVGVRVGGAPFGVRADVRYFRQLSDVAPIADISLGDFAFWRGTLGISFGF